VSLVQQTRSITFKVLGIAALALLMLIPLARVEGLVAEREGRSREATRQIAARWGAEQRLGGPVLVVPQRCLRLHGERTVVVDESDHLLPDRLVVTATLAPELRHYGIHETVVFAATVRVEGRFAAADQALLARDGCSPAWARARVRVPVADVHGIRRASTLRIGARELAFGPDDATVGGIATIGVALAGDDAPGELPFAFEMTLAGSERFAVLPLARTTEARIDGAWPDPGFDGAFVPAERRVDARGFAAGWQVLDLNRRIAQHWVGADAAGALDDAAFGVSLVRPAHAYQQNTRAGKYAVLFVALGFVAFFLFEVLRGLRVHPVQYLLVGLAQCTFYVVLLALSEQVGFGPAYAIAASVTAALVGTYAAAVLATRRAGAMLAGVLGLVYAVLYGLVQSEDYALLMGSLALFATVAALMLLTRRVDWYAMGRGAAAGAAR